MDEIFSMRNDLGMEVICSSVGAGLADVSVPDRDGKIESVLVRPEHFYQYFRAGEMFGKPCGRTAGRISPIRVKAGKESFTIVSDDPNVALHGGKDGISFQTFSCAKKEDETSKYLVFKYVSPDGESGYPGTMEFVITYELCKKENVLRIHHEAVSDKDTLCNLTCHAYFNLSGNAARKITDEELYLNADRVGVLSDDMIARKIMKVDEAFSFLKPHRIGDHIEDPEVQRVAHGYDHPYLLTKADPSAVQARLYDEKSGRELEIRTSYEACVVYSANWPAGFLIQNHLELGKYDAICLEMQHYPNSVHSDYIADKKDVLKAGQKYDEFIEYTFKVR